MNNYGVEESYIPQTTGEIYDLLIAFVHESPSFVDASGDFPWRNLESEFHALNQGWKNVRKKLGEEEYGLAVSITARMKEMFVRDPEDVTGETQEGRKLVYQLEDIIKRSNDRKR